MKNFPIPRWESAKLGIGLQAFNVLNHVNFDQPLNDIASSNFGTIINTVSTPTSIIGSFQIFDTIAVTTQGGPGTSTRTIVWYIYQLAFSSMRMGYASAMSTALFFFLIIITIIQMRVLRSGQSDLG